MNLALIGNCSYSALLENGAVRWLCWPRMDSSFVFGNLLDERQGGVFSVEALEPGEIQQTYLPNTNVVQTTFRGPSGAFELLDFAPRFQQYDRYYKPAMLVRMLRPLHGDPLVRVRCEPVYDYGRARAAVTAESNHLQYNGLAVPIRLTTDLSLTYVQEGRPFRLGREAHLVLTCGQPLESPLRETAQRYLSQTVEHWRRWVKGMRIPREYQDAVIRSALVLKLHQFEDTGALLAATTTSIPEFPRSGRTWDYRFCWLRDSYFTLNALERLGQTEEMERFLHFLRDRCAGPVVKLQPLYGIDGEVDLQERVLEHLAGYHGDGPVRIGNQASEHVQNDVYGEMILAVSRLLLDTRFRDTEGISSARPLVEELLAQVEQRLEEPDAGLWELRNVTRLHAFTLLCHWAGAMRTVEIARVLGNAALAQRAERVAAAAHKLLEERCWDPERGVLVQAAGVKHLDAALLLALHFGFFERGDPRAKSHVEAIWKGLATDDGLLMRYKVADDFGKPEAAFTVCSFWLVEALALVDRGQEARALFEKLLGYRNALGLMSEDILPATGEQSGNFPQTYSHVGLINAAFKLSRGWE